MRHKTLPIWGALVLLGAAMGACSPEPEPRSVDDFLNDPIGLDATLERCNQSRSISKDDVECQHARSASKKLGAIEIESRRAAAEAESKRKLDRIRRANEAQAEAVRRAQNEAALREQEAYEAQFDDSELDSEPAPSNYESYEPSNTTAEESAADYEVPATVPEAVTPPAPEESVAPEASAPGDMDALRQELKRRGEQSSSENEDSSSQQ